MKIENVTLINNPHRDTYWTRIYVESDDNLKSTDILVCVSHEYFWDEFKTMEYTEEQTQQWLNNFIDGFKKNNDDRLFEQPVHYYVFATTTEGQQNGQQFLRNEIKI